MPLYDVISKKKGLHRNSNDFSGRNYAISKKKRKKKAFTEILTFFLAEITVFTRFVARALIFFNLTHCRAPIQTGVYLSTGACYFQSKITTKIIVEDKYFTTFNLSPYDLFTSNTNQHHHPHEYQHHHPHEHQHQNVINAICYAIGRLRRDCCLLALKIQQRCDTSVS